MHILNRFQKSISGAKVLVLGVAYKQDIDDYRESPAIHVIEELKEVGALVDFYDPWVPRYKRHGQIQIGLQELSAETVASYDLVIITTAHSNVDYEMVQKSAKVVFDTKNVMNKVADRQYVEVL